MAISLNGSSRWRIEVPGRVNLIGEHIDYLGGTVLPVAIDRSISLELIPHDHPYVSIVCPLGEQLIDLNQLDRSESQDEYWLNYIIGVLAGYRDAGFGLRGFDCNIQADFPFGAGLSSSAALETAIALAIEARCNQSLSVVDRALICQKAENEYVGVPCGIMDQLSVAAGRENHALLIDCQSLDIEPIPLSSDMAIIVADTGVKHSLADGEYKKRRDDCERGLHILGCASWRQVTVDELERKRQILGARLFNRAQHAVTEFSRVKRFVRSLRDQDWPSMSSLMYAGHQSLRNHYEVSCEELDVLVEAAYQFGVTHNIPVAARMTGGGFGGSTVTLVPKQYASDVACYLEDQFVDQFNRKPSCLLTRASDGARVIKLEF